MHIHQHISCWYSIHTYIDTYMRVCNFDIAKYIKSIYIYIYVLFIYIYIPVYLVHQLNVKRAISLISGVYLLLFIADL